MKGRKKCAICGQRFEPQESWHEICDECRRNYAEEKLWAGMESITKPLMRKE